MYFCGFLKFNLYDKKQIPFVVLSSIFDISGKVYFYSLIKKIFESISNEIPQSFRETFYFYEKKLKKAYIFEFFDYKSNNPNNNTDISSKIDLKAYQEGIIPYSCISFDDSAMQEILPMYNSLYLESTWDNVHKIPFPKELSGGIRILKGIILPDGTYSCYDVPYFEFEIRSEVLKYITKLLEKDGFRNVNPSNTCFGLYKIILEGVNSRQLLIVVDPSTQLPQVSVQYIDQNIRIKISDELAKTLDGVEVMIWYYEDDGTKHYLRLGSIVNGNKSLEEVRLRIK